MKKLITGLYAGVVLALAANVFAVTDTVSASQDLKQLLQQSQSLKGQFEQRLYDRDRHLLQATQGEFVVQRPGNFYWETLPPYEQVVVGNGTRLWVYDPDLEQVTVHDQAQQQQSSPAQLLSGNLDNLEERYAVTRSVDGNRKQFTLTSKGDDATFQRLKLSYKGDTLTELQFEDNLEQVTELSFSNTQTNPQIDKSLFQFKVPQGVDVIIDD